MFAINRKTGRKIQCVCAVVGLNAVDDSFPAVPCTPGKQSPGVFLDGISTLDDVNEVLSYVDEDGAECGPDDLVMTDEDPSAE